MSGCWPEPRGEPIAVSAFVLAEVIRVELFSYIWSQDSWLTNFHPKSEEVWSVEHGAMKCGVVAEHERCHVVLPILGGIVNKRAEILGDHLVEHLGLAVAQFRPSLPYAPI